MPNTASTGKRSNSPSSTITRPPPSFSSAGWKMKCTVPSKLRVSAKYLAAPSSIVVWPSWPQACMRPAFCDLWAKPFFSWMCSASMSALSPIARLPEPTLSVPTTPVPAIPRVTARPNSPNFCATTSEVRCSSNAVSGWAWMSRRHAVMSS